MSSSSSAGSVSVRLVALACLFLSMVSVQTGATYAKHLFAQIGPQGATGLRCGISALVLLLLWRPWRGRLSGKAAKAVLLYGLSLGVMNFSFYMSLERLPLGLAVAVEFIGPLALALVSSRRPLDFLWIALAAVGLLGLSPLSAGNDRLDPIGLGLALLAGGFWAAYIVFGKKALHSMPGTRASALGMLVAGLLTLPAAAHAGTGLLSPSILATAFMVSMLSSTIPYSLEMVALKHMTTKSFSILVSLEPAIAAASGWLVNAERLSLSQLACMGALILASLGCAATHRP